MSRSSYVLDTHTFIWHLEDSPSLSPTARSILEQIEAGALTAVVPSIVGVETVYLAEKNRIPQASLAAALTVLQEGFDNFLLAPLDLPAIQALRRIPRSLVPDMPDRIIAATALAMQLPLLSKDSAIAAVEQIETVW